MLKQILITRKIAETKKRLDEAREKEAGFLVRKSELEAKETELLAALDEVTEETAAEDKEALEAEITTHEDAVKALETEQSEAEGETAKLADEIADLQKELDELNNREKTPPSTAPQPEERKDEKTVMETRMKFFRNMPVERRERIFAADEVRSFVEQVRTLIGEKRTVTGGELTIPNVMLELLRDNLHIYSKLIKHVQLRRVPGKARQTISGQIPEGVWTEMCAKLNELEISFSQVELDGYKVGGFVAVCNALLEDSDINLADEIMHNIGQAIGYALDKAIIYGKGAKMPIGSVTRLAQTAQPSDWGENAPTWTDLHATNIITIDPTGKTAVEFFAELVLAASKPKANYTTSKTKFWAMNSTTFADLQAKALSINAVGAIVSGQNMTMPIVGGAIEILEFMPDGDIFGGYGELYVLGERAGAQLAKSEHVRFIEDQTVIRGTARYDGMPVFGEAFVLINIKGETPTTTIAFAPDTANP